MSKAPAHNVSFTRVCLSIHAALGRVARNLNPIAIPRLSSTGFMRRTISSNKQKNQKNSKTLEGPKTGLTGKVASLGRSPFNRSANPGGFPLY